MGKACKETISGTTNSPQSLYILVTDGALQWESINLPEGGKLAHVWPASNEPVTSARLMYDYSTVETMDLGTVSVTATTTLVLK